MNKPYKYWLGILALQMGLFASQALATVNDPVVTAVGGASTSPQTITVTVSESTNGATIYFTTDGTNPTTASGSIPSGGSLLIAKNSTLNVQAFQAGSASNLVSVNYGIDATVSAGAQHSLILKDDGTVWASGDNSAGELGNGTTTSSSTPVQVLAPLGQSGFLQNIIAVAADANESFAVDNQGNVWAWGANTNGQLGVGNTVNESLPTRVSGVSGAVAVTTGQSHTIVLRNDGTVWGWGANTSGQIGNGALTAWETIPVQVMAGPTQPMRGLVAIVAGANHTVAIDNNGNVWAWGANTSGQLGNGDTSGTAQTYPVQAYIASVVTIAAGTSNSYALQGNGNVWAWGDNSVGELGNGTTSTAVSATPTEITTLGSMVSLGNQLAVDASDNVWAWGDDTSGRLGFGAQGNDATLPLEVSFYSGAAAALADTAGNNQTVDLGAFSAPLTVTVTNGGNPVANAVVDFTIIQGGGLLALSAGSTQFSGIEQVVTNASGQATIYFQEASSGSGNSQITATSDDGQSQFTVINGGIGVPALPGWGYALLGILMFFAMGRFLVKKQPRLAP